MGGFEDAARAKAASQESRPGRSPEMTQERVSAEAAAKKVLDWIEKSLDMSYAGQAVPYVAVNIPIVDHQYPEGDERRYPYKKTHQRSCPEL